MPISKTGAVSHLLMYFSVDMASLSSNCTFHSFMDGQKIGELTFSVPQEHLVPILMAVPNSGLSRADDITVAIYNYAVTHSIISGEIA